MTCKKIFYYLLVIYGKEIEDDKDIIIIESNNKRITLKRLYG